MWRRWAAPSLVGTALLALPLAIPVPDGSGRQAAGAGAPTAADAPAVSQGGITVLRVRPHAVVGQPGERLRAEYRTQLAEGGRSGPSGRTATGQAGAAGQLAAFHDRLRRLEAGEAGHVHVLMIGDSHTASDHLSGRLRALLQQRFGNGGRGFLAPGVPHAHYRPYGVGVAQAGGWRLLTSNKSQPDGAAYGLAGIVMRGNGAGSIAVDDRSGAETAWLEVQFQSRSDGGNVDVTVDGQAYGRFGTRDNSPALVKLEGRGRRVELRLAGDGPVDLAGLRLVSHTPGVALSSVGFIGAEVRIIGRWHAETLRRQIAELDPALLILAFGTNEGFASPERIQGSYARELERRLAQLREAAPGASIVVVGPPDANRYPRFCLPPPKVTWEPLAREKNAKAPATRETDGRGPGGAPPDGPAAGDGAPANPPAGAAGEPAAPVAPPPAPTAPSPPPAASADAATPQPAAPQAGLPAPDSRPGYRRVVVYPDPPADAACKPLDGDERGRYDALIEARDRRLCRWHTPAAIPVVRQIQRQVAEAQGALFFDWSELFDGECGADRWSRRGLAHKDRVHFRQEGYHMAADRLHAALLAGYERAR